MERIDESVRKILMAKYYAGLNVKPVLSTANLSEDLKKPEHVALVQELADASMTMLRGKQFMKTFSPEKRTVIISIGTTGVTTFQRELGKHYSNSVMFTLDKNATANSIAAVMRELAMFDQIIIGIHDSRTRPGNGMVLSQDLKMFLKSMTSQNAVFALFANPYNLSALGGLELSKGLVVAYQKEDFMQRAAADVISNIKIANGKLPVSVNTFFKYGDGE